MNPIEIKDGVYWVGAIDWSERDFHNFEIGRGTTYNAYLIVDEKITLIDTVKHKYFGEMIERIEKIVDPSEIDYIVANHVESDHSGGLGDIKKIAKDAVIYCTKKGMEGFSKHFNTKDWDFNIVKTGSTLNIGKRNLIFLEMAMLHWPDSMAVYLKEDRLLFSNDAFGQHIASEERFDVDLGVDNALEYAKTYYANILLPFGNLIKKKLDEVEKLGIEIEMIAPSHGVIWRNPDKIINAYRDWAEQKTKEKVVVIYDTMWNSTKKIAREIAEGIASEGVEVRLMHLRKDFWSEIMKEVMDAKGVIIGSPTMHNTIFPPVAGFLTYMKGLKPKNRISMAFGSYGWSGGAVKEIKKFFEEMKYEVVEGIEIKFRPTKEELEIAFEKGKEFARRIKGD